jgi:hypothetical protein
MMEQEKNIWTEIDLIFLPSTGIYLSKNCSLKLTDSEPSLEQYIIAEINFLTSSVFLFLSGRVLTSRLYGSVLLFWPPDISRLISILYHQFQ